MTFSKLEVSQVLGDSRWNFMDMLLNENYIQFNKLSARSNVMMGSSLNKNYSHMSKEAKMKINKILIMKEIKCT